MTTYTQIERYNNALIRQIYQVAGGLGIMYVDAQEIRSELVGGGFPEELFACFENRFRQCLKLNSERVFTKQFMDSYKITGDSKADAALNRAVKHFNDEKQGRMFRHFVKTGTIEVYIDEKPKRRAAKSHSR